MHSVFVGLGTQEQRRHPRRQTHMRCWVKDELCRRYAQLKNVSLSGAMVATSGPPSPGQSVILEIRLSTHSPILHIEGSVVWARTGAWGRVGTMGVQFAHISDVPLWESFLQARQ